MPCFVCGSDTADYTCASCKKQICYSHARTEGNAVFCVDCIRGMKPPKEEKNALESAFTYMLILTIGLAVIFFVGEYAIFGLLETYSSLLPGSAKDLITLFRGTSVALLAGSAALTALLFLLSRLTKKGARRQFTQQTKK